MVCFVGISIFFVADHGQSSRKHAAGQTHGELPSSVFGLSPLTTNVCHIASETHSVNRLSSLRRNVQSSCMFRLAVGEARCYSQAPEENSLEAAGVL